MKKAIISVSILSLILFSGCSLFSAKDTANEEIKTDENMEIQQEVKADENTTTGQEVKADIQVLPQAEAQNKPAVIADKVPAVTTETDEAKLAKCLTEKGVELYTSSTCPHCTRQKEAFKDGAQYLPNTECLATDGWSQQCTDKEITAVPTWIFADGQRLTGETPLDVLAEKSGCEYIAPSQK